MDSFDASANVAELFFASGDSVSLLATLITLLLVFFPLESSFPTLASGWIDVLRNHGPKSERVGDITVGEMAAIHEITERDKVPRRVKAVVTALFAIGAASYFIMLDVSKNSLASIVTDLPGDMDFRYIALLISLFVVIYQQSRIGRLSAALALTLVLSFLLGLLFALLVTLLFELAVFGAIDWWLVIVLGVLSFFLGWVGFRFAGAWSRKLALAYTMDDFGVPAHVVSPSSALVRSIAFCLIISGVCYYVAGALCTFPATASMPLESWDTSDGATVERYYNIMFLGTKSVKMNADGSVRRTIQYSREPDHSYGSVIAFNKYDCVTVIGDCEKYRSVEVMVAVAKQLSEQEGYVYGVTVQHIDAEGSVVRSCNVYYNDEDEATGYGVNYYRTSGDKELYRTEEFDMGGDRTGYVLYAYDGDTGKESSSTHYAYDSSGNGYEAYRLDYEYGSDGRRQRTTKVPLASGVVGYTSYPTYRYATDSYLASERFDYTEKYGSWVREYNDDAKETIEFHEVTDDDA